MSSDAESWFVSLKETLEQAYLRHDDPWKQSGFMGTRERWTALRKPVADCIERSGSFLDIGCANGYLLECCMEWTAERDLEIEPYGLDISEALVSLARQRLPRFASHFFTGNALTWQPPRRFDFVRTELVYVPAKYEKRYIEFILSNHLAPGGTLLVANYGEGQTDLEKNLPAGANPVTNITEHLENMGFGVVRFADGYDAVKGRRSRIAVLTAGNDFS